MNNIETTIQQHCATITLKRTHKQNALNKDMIDDLYHAVTQIQSDKHIRCLLIHAHGKHFCSGADYQWLQNASQLSSKDNYEDAQQLARLLEAIATLPILTIAYVLGNCLGGGVGLAACCDIVIADPQAKFACPEVSIGMVPAIILPYLIDKIGLQHAKEWVYSGTLYTADQAQQLQLISQVANAEEARAFIQNWQEQSLKNNTEAFIISKSLFAEFSASQNTRTDLVEIMAKQRLSQPVQQWIGKFLNKKQG